MADDKSHDWREKGLQLNMCKMDSQKQTKQRS